MTVTAQTIDRDLLGILHFQSVEDAGREMLYLSAMAKLSGYREEARAFERKYDMAFETFQRKVDSRMNEEIFEEEDDLMDWRFAHESIAFWERKVAELAPC
jgi:hypothetical protein